MAAKKRGRKILLINQKLTPKNFFELLKLSFLHPHLFAFQISQAKKIKQALTFFVISTVLAAILQSLLQASYYHNSGLVFLSIIMTIFTLILGLTGLLVLALFLHLFARLLKGQSRWQDSLKALAYSSAPLTLSWIPLISPLLLILSLYILGVSFKLIHHYSTAKAVLNIILPVLIWVLILFMLNQLNLLLKLPVLNPTISFI